jgi:carboxymethylenebutenolidase
MANSTSNVEFPANGGTVPGYLAKPEGNGPFPGVVVIQEWWGLDDHIKDVARRYAEEGFVAVAPDLYHGKVATEPNDAQKLAMEMDQDRAGVEIAGAVKYLLGRPDVGKVGVTGFCMGGRLSFLAAYRTPEASAIVPFYGASPEPWSQMANITAPVLAFYAEDDPNITPKVPQVAAAMADAGKDFEYTIYPGTHHAFFNDDRPHTYSAEASADTWKRALAFFRDKLS